MASLEPPDSKDANESDGEAVGTPRWVKIFGLVALGVVAVMLLFVLAGHDPGRHSSREPISLVAAFLLQR